eukprot:21381_1
MITKYGCCAVHGIVNDAVSKRLYQKVAKELLSRLKSGKHKFGAINKGNIDWNCAVFLMDLASTMQQKMNEDQDKVQMCAVNECCETKSLVNKCLLLCNPPPRKQRICTF